jgi:DNA-binding transcriptional MerR regulator
MRRDSLFAIADFSEFSRLSRDTLYHYDRIGLLSPATRGENGYRYYSKGQLAVANVIRTLHKLGMSLTEIKALLAQRTPDQINTMLLNQMEEIDRKIDDWISARKLLSALQKSIYPVLHINEGAVTVQSLPEEAIVLGGLNDYSDGKKAYDALASFYSSMKNRYPGLDLNCPVWGMFSEGRVSKRDWALPDRYYFYSPKGQDKKPAALYAVGYARGGYGQTEELYERILRYIDENGFEICGPAFEEYPLNEICVKNENEYLIRVMITVRKERLD